MGMFTYKDVPAALVPFSKPAFDLIRNEDRIAVFDFKNDLVVILDHTTPANGFIGTVQEAIAAGIVSFARATAASRFNAAGVRESVASGIWRRQYDPATLQPLGYLPEPQRTNATRNNTMVGAVVGSPGTQPTGWYGWAGTANGLTFSIAGLGVEDGIDYVDIRAVGTADATAGYRTGFGNNGDQVASSGQIWTASGFFRLVANPGVNLPTFQLETRSFTTDGAIAGQVFVPTTAALRTQRYSVTSAAMGAGVASIVGTMRFGINLGVTYDFTLRIGLPQLELGNFMTSPIRTSGAAVTRNADVMAADVSKLPWSATAGTRLFVAWPSPDAATTGFSLGQIRNSDNDRFLFRNNTAGTRGLQGLGIAAGVSGLLTAASNIATGHFKTGWAWQENDFELVAAGASKAIDSAGAVPSGLSTYGIGHYSNIAQWAAPLEADILIPRRVSQAEMIARTAA